MEPVQGLNIRSMTERDFAGIDDVDKRITGREWAGAASQQSLLGLLSSSLLRG